MTSAASVAIEPSVRVRSVDARAAGPPHDRRVLAGSSIRSSRDLVERVARARHSTLRAAERHLSPKHARAQAAKAAKRAEPVASTPCRRDGGIPVRLDRQAGWLRSDERRHRRMNSTGCVRASLEQRVELRHRLPLKSGHRRRRPRPAFPPRARSRGPRMRRADEDREDDSRLPATSASRRRGSTANADDGAARDVERRVGAHGARNSAVTGGSGGLVNGSGTKTRRIAFVSRFGQHPCGFRTRIGSGWWDGVPRCKAALRRRRARSRRRRTAPTPVMYAARSEQRNAMAFAMSCGSPARLQHRPRCDPLVHRRVRHVERLGADDARDDRVARDAVTCRPPSRASSSARGSPTSSSSSSPARSRRACPRRTPCSRSAPSRAPSCAARPPARS